MLKSEKQQEPPMKIMLKVIARCAKNHLISCHLASPQGQRPNVRSVDHLKDIDYYGSSLTKKQTYWKIHRKKYCMLHLKSVLRIA